MTTVIVEFEVGESVHRHVVNWMIGELYRLGYEVLFDKDVYNFMWTADVWVDMKDGVEAEPFVLFANIMDDLYNFMRMFEDGFIVAICGDKECVEIRYEDIERYKWQEWAGYD